MDDALLTELRGITARRGVTRYRALADALGDAIRGGRLAVDDRLPAERGLAISIGVSRNTVVAAYEELRVRGLVSTRPGSGTVVEPGASPVASPREAWLTGALQPGAMLDRVVSPTRAPIDMRASGFNDGLDVPAELLELSATDLAPFLSTAGYSPAGIPALRDRVAGHLTAEGLPTDASQIVITSGSQQAVSLLVRALVAPGSPVAVEELTSAGVMAALTVAQADIHGVRLTPQGIDVAALVRTVERHRPVMVHLSSAVQQPTGTVMTVSAARRLVYAAETWRTVVVDDRSRAMLQFRGDPPPPLASFVSPSSGARIVTIGSLSRVVWPGLRIGWMRLDRPSTAERMFRLRTVDDLGLSVPSQLVALKVMDRLPEIAAGRRATLVERYHGLVHAMGRHLPELRVEETRGGWIVPVRLPIGRASRFAAIARTAGVEILPASIAAVGDLADDRILMPLGVDSAIMRAGVERLGVVWRQYRRELTEPATSARRRLDVPLHDNLAPRPGGIESYRPPT